MLWIIGEGKKIDEVFSNDQKNLSENASLMDNVHKSEYSYDLKTVNAGWEGDLDDDEDIFVLAHSGLDPEPWIGGLLFDKFAGALISKFGADRLADRKIWFLTCLSGDHVVDLAKKLKAKGAEGTELYMPAGFMFVSAAGIPHIITGYATLDAVNTVVAGNASKYNKLKDLGAKPTGIDWRGAKISDDDVTAIGTDAARDAVRARFDENHSEYPAKLSAFGAFGAVAGAM